MSESEDQRRHDEVLSWHRRHEEQFGPKIDGLKGQILRAAIPIWALLGLILWRVW